MNATAGRVYSYTRFSTAAQAKGDSLRRQTKEATDWAAANGMVLDDTLTLHDPGLSAWTGENEGGQLGAFLQAVKDKLVPRGSVLAVENLDRLSRQGIRKTRKLVEDIIDLGVSVVTTKDGKLYDEAALDDPMASIMLILTATRAREESDLKSRRVAAAWANKRTRALENKTVLTKNGPSWLTLSNGRKRWTVDETKADAVRRVFALAVEGHGPAAIASRLNDAQVPSLRGEMWRPGAVNWLLDYTAVVGTLTLNHRDETGRETVERYYPAIVDATTFSTVQAMRSGGQRMAKGRHATTGVVRNMLAGLARCPLCDKVMTRCVMSARDGSTAYLICDGARYKAGCRYHSVPLRRVEDALVLHAEQLTGHAEIAAGGPVLAELQATAEMISVTEDELQTVLDMLARGPSPVIRERGRQLEDELDRLKATAADLSTRAAVSSGLMVVARLDKLRAALTAETADIRAVNVALRACASKVVVDFRTGYLVVHWVHGGTTEIMFAFAASERAEAARASDSEQPERD